MKQKIPLFKIYWDEEDVEHICGVIKRGNYWTTGPNVALFEKMIAEYLGSRYCIVFNSGTSALHAVLLAYNIGAGDEVIVPSFTFIATANAPLFVGASPIFSDIEEMTFGLDPESVKRKITRRTRAILPIHFGGLPCLIEKLRDIAYDNGLLLIEDAAEAFGSRVGGKKVGTFGDAAVLSFCQNKIITTGEGGAVVTDNQDIYHKLKLIRSHGRMDTGDYFSSGECPEYVTLGYNFRLSDIAAALGIAQLKKVDRLIDMRRQNAVYLNSRLSRISKLYSAEIPENYYHVYQMYTIRIKEKREVRDKLVVFLQSRSVTSKVNFSPVHLTRFYRETFGYHGGELPVTEKVSEQIITLPMYPSLTREDTDYVVEQIENFFASEAYYDKKN